jgi:hypothetical protein
MYLGPLVFAGAGGGGGGRLQNSTGGGYRVAPEGFTSCRLMSGP